MQVIYARSLFGFVPASHRRVSFARLFDITGSQVTSLPRTEIKEIVNEMMLLLRAFPTVNARSAPSVFYTLGFRFLRV